MKSIARYLMPALVLALMGIVGSSVNAFAQFPVPIGTRIRCPFSGTITINQNGRDYAGTISGYGTFQVIASDPRSATYTPVDIGATSIFPELGTYTTALDAAAQVPPSVARSITGGGYPVSIDMIYPPVVTGPDGTIYTSTTGPVNFYIDQSNSFNPIVNENSHLLGPSTFTSRDGSQVFTVVSINATFTPAN